MYVGHIINYAYITDYVNLINTKI